MPSDARVRGSILNGEEIPMASCWKHICGRPTTSNKDVNNRPEDITSFSTISSSAYSARILDYISRGLDLTRRIGDQVRLG
jgi:hypothetical protein